MDIHKQMVEVVEAYEKGASEVMSYRDYGYLVTIFADMLDEHCLPHKQHDESYLTELREKVLLELMVSQELKLYLDFTLSRRKSGNKEKDLDFFGWKNIDLVKFEKSLIDILDNFGIPYNYVKYKCDFEERQRKKQFEVMSVCPSEWDMSQVQQVSHKIAMDDLSESYRRRPLMDFEPDESTR